MTELLVKAFEELSKLPDDRQNELARMLLDVAESDRLLAEGVYQLTPEQWAEVEAAIAEDDWATDEEVEALFSRARS